MDFFILFATGLSVGLVSAFFGIGGGAIMVPVLYALFPQLPPASIISVSLGTIVLNTALNNWRFYKQGACPGKHDSIIIVLCAAAGAVLGAQVLYLLSAPLLKKVFGLLLLAMAARILLDKSRTAAQKNFQPRVKILGAVCLGGSFLSSITGLGGGAIFVPMFLAFAKLPVNRLSPYSNVAMMAASFMGLVPHFFRPGEFELKSALAQKAFLGHVNLLFILCLFAGAFISSRLGIKLHGMARPRLKKRLLAGLLFVLAFKILFSA